MSRFPLRAERQSSKPPHTHTTHTHNRNTANRKHNLNQRNLILLTTTNSHFVCPSAYIRASESTNSGDNREKTRFKCKSKPSFCEPHIRNDRQQTPGDQSGIAHGASQSARQSGRGKENDPRINVPKEHHDETQFAPMKRRMRCRKDQCGNAANRPAE